MNKTILLIAALCFTVMLGFAQADTSKAQVHIYRLKESGLYPKTKTAIYCNGEKLAQIGNGRIFTITLEPGTYMLRARDKKEPGIEFEVKAGEEYYVRADMDMTRLRFMRKPNFRLTLIDKTQAIAETKELKPMTKDDIKDPRVTSP